MQRWYLTAIDVIHQAALDDDDLRTLNRSVKAYQSVLAVLGDLEVSKQVKDEADNLARTWSRLMHHGQGKCHCSHPALGGTHT